MEFMIRTKQGWGYLGITNKRLGGVFKVNMYGKYKYMGVIDFKTGLLK